MSEGPPIVPEHWQRVAEELRQLIALIEAPGSPVDFNTRAKGLARAANAYYDAIGKEGLTSMRLQAVCKALDLKTPKSALTNFLGQAGT
jgi:hypothetical protein